MKTILLSIIFLSLFACNKSDPATNPVQKYFNPDNLSKLILDSVPDFWENNNFKIDDTFWNYIIYPEENNKGIMYSIRIDGPKNYKWIGVSVFETHEKAITQMKYRISEIINMPVFEGSTKSPFPGEWWYANETSSIYVNQWNTIIEVVIGSKGYKDFENELMETAAEIAKRVDRLSQTIE
jgi:hypothetical protein